MSNDMAKAIDRGMVIEAVRLLEKRGGKSGEWRADVVGRGQLPRGQRPPRRDGLAEFGLRGAEQSAA